MSSTIFVSSVQKELAADRRSIRDFVEADPLLRRFFRVFLFEDLPAKDARPDAVYLDEVDRAAVYVGLFGNQYGFEDQHGLSPTEHEFSRATSRGLPRFIFVRGSDDGQRHPKMARLIRRAGEELIRKRYRTIPELTAALYASLVSHLAATGAVSSRPFDAAACPGASLSDVSEDRLRWFLERARSQRRYSVPPDTSVVEALRHLDLLDGDFPSHAAILLFGKAPQRYLPTSEVKCLHFHGTEVRKPIPSYQVFKGTVFELVDQAVDFIMSKVARRVGTRSAGPTAPVEYELPRDAVAEAIVNAVAHRDYSSKASVQVMLFADRFEVWNPGELPATLTFAQLRRAHPSIPRNPLLADPLFLAGYIEKAGTGTLDMIDRLREAGLPEPEFRQDGGTFVQVFWRDWLTPEALASLDLGDRQKQTLAHVRIHGRIDNAGLRKLTGVTKATATRDLEGLAKAGLLRKVGRTGKGTHYTLSPKGLIKGSKGALPTARPKGSQRAHRDRDAATTPRDRPSRTKTKDSSRRKKKDRSRRKKSSPTTSTRSRQRTQRTVRPSRGRGAMP